jgi:cysteine dioxygenase
LIAQKAANLKVPEFLMRKKIIMNLTNQINQKTFETVIENSDPDCLGLMSFGEIVQYIRKLDVPLKREEIEQLLSRLIVTAGDYQKYLSYEQTYGRVSVVKSKTEAAELLVMTWRKNQESPIHDHFESACGIRVLEGTMTEIMYEIVRKDRVLKLSAKELSAGIVASSNASIDIHKVANFHDDLLVTAHIYSPPLDKEKMRRFVEIG